MYRVITVCTGNICRSPMAEIMLARAFMEAGLQHVVSVDSAGTTEWEVGKPIDPRAAAKLASQDLASAEHVARHFEASWYRDRHLILALDLDHYEHLRANAPDAESSQKVRLMREFEPSSAGVPLRELGIYDPWFGDKEDFETTWALINGAVPGVVDHVKNVVRDR
ncbi:low molecular weight protein-tyrosine-phosphatase [Arthrobacter roseus]|uniref:low molecular weight protein-tyrosine-phosphatase n=1 Tax=Arthrobacter roseus TaxID=136274 RepID=UPI0019642DF7|nr:low molecular weight protein-tyrosine-phosphatase [Arthrobacter roseus]MBM7849697.1 protein-tyrosine phosphatase [Arthrobacter roseus]